MGFPAMQVYAFTIKKHLEMQGITMTTTDFYVSACLRKQQKYGIFLVYYSRIIIMDVISPIKFLLQTTIH
jgi:hypothetical protein